jgi:hypothetical protein
VVQPHIAFAALVGGVFIIHAASAKVAAIASNAAWLMAMRIMRSAPSRTPFRDYRSELGVVFVEGKLRK